MGNFHIKIYNYVETSTQTAMTRH